MHPAHNDARRDGLSGPFNGPTRMNGCIEVQILPIGYCTPLLVHCKIGHFRSQGWKAKALYVKRGLLSEEIHNGIRITDIFYLGHDLSLVCQTLLRNLTGHVCLLRSLRTYLAKKRLDIGSSLSEPHLLV